MSWSSIAIAVLLVLLAIAGLMLRSSRERNRKLSLELGAAYDSTEVLQQSFNRFAPWQLVDELADGGTIPEAAERTVTVVFVDICDFTRLCEKLTPASTIALLNRYYALVNDAVGKNRGYISKYIGDGALAVFGALDNNPWQVDDAVHAALSIVENARQTDLSDIEGVTGRLRACIGIHTGPAIAGATGAGELLEFTVLGATVNLAARVERLTRTLGVELLVTEDVREKLDPGFVVHAQPPQSVKGISNPILTYSVSGYSGQRLAV